MIHMICADALLVDASTIDGGVMITDPPYSEHVHSAAISQANGGGIRLRDFGFRSLNRAARRKIAEFASHVGRWSVVYSDWESIGWLQIAAHAQSAQWVRVMPWERWSMPNLTGTVPPQGSEAICLLHRADRGPNSRKLKPRAKHWNGPGNLTGFHELSLRGAAKYSAEKPLDQALRLVSWFSDPGELVFDPFAGVGTIGQACRLLDRDYVGLEVLPNVAERGRARLTSALDKRDAERCQRWLDTCDEPESEPTAPSAERAARRADDKARCARNARAL